MAVSLVEGYMQNVWLDQSKIENAEYQYQEYLAKQQSPGNKSDKGDGHGHGVAQQIAVARKKIQQTLKGTAHPAQSPSSDDVRDKMLLLEKENTEMRQKIKSLTNRLGSLESRISALESGSSSVPASAISAQDKPKEEQQKPQEDSDSDLSLSDDDLFGSEDEEQKAEAEKIRQERLAAYAEKKKKKPGPIAKSNIILDIKPWEDETDMKALEDSVRSIETDGLLWGTSKLVEVAYGIKKLVISCVVEDDKVGTDFLEEKICDFADYVQSVDVAAFNKI